MRSFLGRDILSLKEFERNEFEHVFAVADELRPIAERRQNTDTLTGNLGDDDAGIGLAYFGGRLCQRFGRRAANA